MPLTISSKAVVERHVGYCIGGCGGILIVYEEVHRLPN